MNTTRNMQLDENIHLAPAVLRIRYPVLAAAVLFACCSTGVLAKSSSPTGAVHGRQIVTVGSADIERGVGPEVLVKELPGARDDDNTDEHSGWRYQWQVAGSDVGSEVEIGLVDPIPPYTIRPEDYDQSLRLCLKATASSGYPMDTRTSEPSCSDDLLLKDSAPTAIGVAISGMIDLGQTLTGEYTFVDAEGDVEADTAFQWYRANNAAGTNNKVAISGATTQSYVVQSADHNKFLIFEVTPKAVSGKPVQGESVAVVASERVPLGMVDNFSAPDGMSRNWSDANSYCDNLTQHGYSDWRLPTRNELLAFYSKYPNNQISTIYGWPTINDYWSATLQSSGYHYTVSLNSGNNYMALDTYTTSVTCVR